MWRWSAIFFVLFALAVAGTATFANDRDEKNDGGVPLSPFPISIGYVHEAKALTAVVSLIANEKLPFMVFHETRLNDVQRADAVWAAVSAGGTPADPQFLWKMRYGVFWNPDQRPSPLAFFSQCIRIPLGDLPDHAVIGFAEGQKRLQQKYKDKDVRLIRFSFHLEPLAQKLAMDVSDDYQTEKNQTGSVFSFDCLPVSATDVLLFMLHRSQITIWLGKGKPSANRPDIEMEWTKRETMAAGFQENFRVEGDAENYYFVTRSGRVFASLNPPAGRPRRVEVLWSDTVRPVRTLIADANTGRTFVFAPAPEVPPDEMPGPDKSVYFELTPDFKSKNYDAAKLPTNKLTGRIKTVVSHVDFLIEKKLIALPPAKP